MQSEYFTVGNAIIHYDELHDELRTVTAQRLDWMDPQYISPVHYGSAVVTVVNGLLDDNVIHPLDVNETIDKVWDYVFHLCDITSL